MDAADGVLNKLAYIRDGSGEYKIKTGPSTRRLINFADVENSLSILPTGQSGNPLSDHYNDQAELYAKGKWRKMLMNKTEIEQNSTNTLILNRLEKNWHLITTFNRQVIIRQRIFPANGDSSWTTMINLVD